MSWIKKIMGRSTLRDLLLEQLEHCEQQKAHHEQGVNYGLAMVTYNQAEITRLRNRLKELE